MKCRFCGYNYRGKSVTVNAHISHLKVKHDFVASNVTTENGGEQYLPELIQVGVEQQQREGPLSIAEQRRKHIIIQNKQRDESQQKANRSHYLINYSTTVLYIIQQHLNTSSILCYINILLSACR